MTNILNRLHAGLELRLPVTSFTYRVCPFPIATGLGRVGIVEKKGGGRGLVPRACAKAFLGERRCAHTVPTLYTRGSSVIA